MNVQGKDRTKHTFPGLGSAQTPGLTRDRHIAQLSYNDVQKATFRCQVETKLFEVNDDFNT